jgi:hypothetical protein
MVVEAIFTTTDSRLMVILTSADKSMRPAKLYKTRDILWAVKATMMKNGGRATTKC